MGVAGACNILRGGSVLVGEHTFGDHLTSVGSHDVNAEHSVGLSAAQNLDQTFGILVSACSRVGTEWEDTLSVWNTSLLQFFFGLADVGDLRVSVDHTWDGIVVDVTALSKNVLNDSDALFFGLVSKHLSLDSVTNSVDGWNFSLPVVVDNDLATVVHGHTSVLKAETASEGVSANANKDDI